MAFKEFDGKLDEDTTGSFKEFTGELDSPSKKAGFGIAIKSAFADIGNTADTAASMIAGGGASLFNDEEEAASIYKNMEARNKSRKTWANPNNEEIGFGGKVAGMAATFPMQVLNAGLTPSTTGKELLDSGETMSTAGKGAAIDALGNAVGIAIPGFKQGALATRAATGAAVGAGQELATKLSIQGVAQTQEGKNKFQPTLEDSLLAGAVGGTVGAAAKQKPNVRNGPDLKALEAELVALPKGFKEFNGQMDMFGESLNVASPYNAGQVGVVEPITPKRQARQMELPLEGPETLIATPEGTNIPLSKAPDALQARELLGDRMLAELDAQARIDMLAALPESQRMFAEGPSALPKPPEKTWFTGSPEVLTNTRTLAEQSTRANAEKQKAGPGHYISTSQDLASVYGGKEGRMYSVEKPFENAFDFNTKGNESAYKKMVAEFGSKAKANEALANRGYDAITFTNSKGEAIANIFNERPTKDIGPARQKIAEQQLSLETYTPGKYVPKSQRGAVKIDWKAKDPLNHMKKIPGMDKRLKNLLPDQSTPEQFFEANKNTPDVEQNMLQRGFNMLTKGGVYQTMKTDNPLIKRVVDRFIDADNASKAETQRLVHEFMEPMARKLNDKEKADVWAAIKIAETNATPLTPEIMSRYGFNEKQVDWAQAHQEVMGKMFEKLSASMKAAGIEPVSPMVAYAAARARGDFRKLVYKGVDEQGNPTIVGILGANTRKGLERESAKYAKHDPEAKIGEERYFGGVGKNGTSEGFNQMLEFLSKNDPAIKDFVTKVNEQAQKDAFDYMNAKSHTMNKKGIFGMEGNKPFLDAAENAKEGMRAQVRYAETMIKWAEISEAVKDTKQFMSPENGLNMPNAKAYLNNYIDNALGHNPTELGRALDQVTSAFGKSTGLGTTIPSKVMSGAKQITNGILLGLNPMFLLANMVQPLKVMPEMSSFVKKIGLDKDFDLGTGYSYIGKAAMDMLKDPKSLDPVIKDALTYAEKNHVYASDLFETGGDVTNSPKLMFNKVTQYGASQIEHVTRKAMFLSFTRILHENGIKAEAGLYDAARKLTDMAMNNYSSIEAPMAYSALGGAGKAAYNLMSYKHNELSRISMFARDLPVDKFSSPLLISLASQVAFAGIKGTILYAEANEIVKYITAKLGNPTSLTKMLLDGSLSPIVTHGMFSAVGADMTSRLGMSIVPGSAIDAVMPGAGKLIDIGKSGVELAKNPNEFNAKSLARDVAPGVLAGPMDRAWFSPENAKGEEMSLNRNKMQATAVRNDADKMWKSVGGTGINESKQRAKTYENSQIEMAYAARRASTLENIAKNYYTTGAIDDKLVDKYMRNEGDNKTLDRELVKMAEDQKVDQTTLQNFKLSMSKSMSSDYKLKRRMGN